MTQVTWRPNVPPDIRSAVESHLLRWFAFVPRWCHELIIEWQCNEDDCDLLTTTVYEYRWARITVKPSFLNRSEAERSSEVLHELMHIGLAPLLVATGDVLDFVREKHPDVFEWGKEARRAGMEAAIVDLTESIVRHVTAP